jgi:hypothetical protein
MSTPIICPHLNDNICELASWMANQPIETTPEKCEACQRCNKPMDVNEITNSLAGIEHRDDGPGTTLARTISWFVRKPQDCNCADRVDLMNSWGKERCQQELPTILSWLRESALDNGYPYSERVIALVLRIILF